MYPKTRKKCEKAMFAYLKALHDQDPDEFHKRYYWRSLAGKCAQTMFPVLLDAYARAHRLALLGEMPGKEKESSIDAIQDAAMLRLFGCTGNVVPDILAEIYPELLPRWGTYPIWITIYDYSWFRFWLKWRIRPICQVALHPKTITHLVGCVENFFISTDTLSIWFGERRVRVFAFPVGEQDIEASDALGIRKAK